MIYEKIFSELNKHKVDYIVIGGVALVLHGVVRLTADLDLVISLKENNLKKFLGVMKKLGYKPNLPLDADELIDERKRKKWQKEKNMQAFSFINLKSPLELIDIMINEPLNFEEIRQNRVLMKSGNVNIPVASIKHLIRIKSNSGREQDIADIDALRTLGRNEKK